MLSAPPLSLYIHFPWCIRKCPYCDFNSHTLQNDLPEDFYIHQLMADLDQDLPYFQETPVLHSIFLGGGTPSLFSGKALEKLFNHIQKKFSLPHAIEITLEANPGTMDYERFQDFYQAGINRLSLGIQSFHKGQLAQLGRIHSAHDAIHAIEAMQKAGFQNFNLDLMHGLPGQTVDEALQDLKMGLSFQPPHLSWYQLTLEKNTYFAKFPPKLPDADIIDQMEISGYQMLAENGLKHYEISAFCKKDFHSRHNLNYWQFGDYLGIGAGAHSKITDVANQKILRTWKMKNPKDYLNATDNFLGEKSIITADALPFEFMLNALRLYESIPIQLFSERTGLSLDTIKPVLEKARDKGLISWDETEITQTDLGQRFYNDLLEMFLDSSH